MYYLSVSAILKNEALYIQEWLQFYLKQGVEHFYLYDNESTDTMREVAKSFDKFITWHTVKGIKRQLETQNHTIKAYRAGTEWCAFLDCDEFLFATRQDRFVDTVRKFYDRPEISAIGVHWLLFGSSGHEFYSDAPVTKRFIRRANEVNPHVKSIVRLRDATYSINPHVIALKHRTIGEYGIDLLKPGVVGQYALNFMPSADILRINHYVTKSKAECAIRRSRVRADTGELHGEGFFESHDRNDVEDKDIWRVL